jgi:hypothetical protein
MIRVVNMIPNGWSDEQNQDSEPNLSVNPANPNEIIATAFTYDNPAGTSAISPAMSAAWAPIYHSTDGGLTWALRNVLPSRMGRPVPTGDVTARFGGKSGTVYAGLISSDSGWILITRAPDAMTRLQTLVTRSGDQPFVEATTALGGAGVDHDTVYVGYRSDPASRAIVDQSLDAASAPAPAGFAAIPVGVVGAPPTRVAIHALGTVYAAFYSSQNYDGTYDVVVVKDLNWGVSTTPYQALKQPGSGGNGVAVVAGIPSASAYVNDPNFGNDRFGTDLTLAVDPIDDERVYIVYSRASSDSDYTLRMRRSNDGGATWSADIRTISKAKNPGIAINTLGQVGFLYQQVVGPAGSSRWITIFEHSSDNFSTFDSHTLANVPSSVPVPSSVIKTYIGDYINLQAIGRDFYGIFSASNAPDMTNFPSGVIYQRNFNGLTATLLGNDGVTPVPVSIDPFFFTSRTIDPALDFYVRDWTDSPVAFDTGVEPSTNADFYTTSDVWNQRSNTPPMFNSRNQPNSEDPQMAVAGPNYAFARISRRAPALAGSADVTVDAYFLYADLGVGVPFVDVSDTPTTKVTFHATDTQLLSAGVGWLLPATHSKHVCLAVEITSPDDPIQRPSLFGMPPGWSSGTDATVLTDNNKAQRNMGVYPIGQSARPLGGMSFYAVLHSGATLTRDLLLEYAGGSVQGIAAREVTVSVYGTSASVLSPGEVLRVPGMLPGENRWLTIHMETHGASSAPIYHDFREVHGGNPLGGFRIVAQPATTASLVRSNIEAEHALVARTHALFGDEPPARIGEILKQLAAHRGEDDLDGYIDYVTEFVLKSKYVELLETKVDVVPVDVETHHRRIQGAARRRDMPAVAEAHAILLHHLDALLTMAQKARGDIADILLNLQWQRALYARAPLPLSVVNEIRRKSMEFFRDFQERKVAAERFPPFIHRLLPDFEKTAHELGPPGRRLEPFVRRLAKKVADPNTVQKDHRAFLIELQSLL